MLLLCFAVILPVILTSVRGCSLAFTASGLTKDSSKILKFQRVELNNGSSYSGLTGKFTCKVSGVYHFSVVLSRKRAVFGNVHAYLSVAGHLKLTLFGQIQGAYPLSASGTFHLNQNDEVYVQGFPEKFFGGTYSFFTGYLITSS